jgi:hypothetical protein
MLLVRERAEYDHRCGCEAESDQAEGRHGPPPRLGANPRLYPPRRISHLSPPELSALPVVPAAGEGTRRELDVLPERHGGGCRVCRSTTHVAEITTRPFGEEAPRTGLGPHRGRRHRRGTERSTASLAVRPTILLACDAIRTDHDRAIDAPPHLLKDGEAPGSPGNQYQRGSGASSCPECAPSLPRP